MNFYLAGKVEAKDSELSLAKLSDQLEARGHRNLLAWWTRSDVKTPYLEYAETNQPAALAMLDAARDCELFVLLAHSEILGAAVEFGAALASSLQTKLVYVVGAQSVQQSIFYAHPRVKHVNSIRALEKEPWY